MSPVPSRRRSRRLAAAAAAGGAGLLAAAATSLPASAAAPTPTPTPTPRAEHVLLLSIDGIHNFDLDRYVHLHPTSALAALVHGGREFTRARTPFPSDSFPGMVAQVTGGNPKSTGVYYDDSSGFDVVGIARYGTVYTGGHGKIAEHGGGNPQDREVPLVISGAGAGAPAVIGGPVATTQIAPTVLRLLGLDPQALQAVRIEGTRPLPLG
jgi:arylsulfatase A-like enzyme